MTEPVTEARLKVIKTSAEMGSSSPATVLELVAEVRRLRGIHEGSEVPCWAPGCRRSLALQIDKASVLRELLQEWVDATEDKDWGDYEVRVSRAIK